MITEVRVGSTDVAMSDGVVTMVRGGKTGEMFVADSHARYYDAVRRGNVFMAAIPVTALSVNSTTFTGLALANPVNSGKALVLMEVCVGISTSTTASAGVILTGGAQTTAISTNAVTIQNAYLGKFAGAGSVAFASSGATITTATMMRAIWDTQLATSATAPTPAPAPYIKDQIDGALIIGPGQLVSLQAITTAISVIASITWEEVPV
jgi:hypothetical protein